jgi:hypothetical protein
VAPVIPAASNALVSYIAHEPAPAVAVTAAAVAAEALPDVSFGTRAFTER